MRIDAGGHQAIDDDTVARDFPHQIGHDRRRGDHLGPLLGRRLATPLPRWPTAEETQDKQDREPRSRQFFWEVKDHFLKPQKYTPAVCPPANPASRLKKQPRRADRRVDLL
jgi:hypothetical protein